MLLSRCCCLDKQASGNSTDNCMFSIFWVNVTLTVRGLANWILVARRVHEYIEMVRSSGPQKWIFDEAQQIARTRYDYLDEEEESELAERLSIAMAPLFGKARYTKSYIVHGFGSTRKLC